jgi:predicted ribosome quality control (RQC) complex YloA/Tae2 family protein
MLSLVELRRAGRILNTILPGSRAQRFVQPDETSVVIVFAGAGDPWNLLVCCRPDFARVCMVEQAPASPSTPLSFGQYLRAHLARARFERVDVSPNDRRMELCLSSPEGTACIVLSILGSRSNVYLLDAEQRVVHSIRPIELTRRDLKLGDRWIDEPGGVRSGGEDRWANAPDQGFLAAIGKEYEKIERSRESETLARKLDVVLGKESVFLARKASNLIEDLGEARQAERDRHRGELLKSVLHTISPGDDSVIITDYETGDQVSIPLDPNLSPSENLEVFFAKYHKETRGIATIQRQIEEVRENQKEIEGLQRKLQLTMQAAEPDLAQLKVQAAHPRARRLLGRYYPEQKLPSPVKSQGKKEIPGKLQPKRYRSEEGFEIWVGKSDEGNDYLTTRLARGNDLFFHLEGYPGSHVVLRTEGRKDPPPGAMLDACELAVHYSRMKESSRADVHVAAIKDVKKPKGVKPGLVYVLKGKTVHLRRDPKRLRNILAARLDE